MSSNDDLTNLGAFDLQQRRSTRRLLGVFAVIWLVVCAFAFALMMGWL